MSTPVIPAEILDLLSTEDRYFYARAVAGWSAICGLVSKSNPREVVREVLLYLSGGNPDAELPREARLNLTIQWAGEERAASYNYAHIAAALCYGVGVPWTRRACGRFLPDARWAWNSWSKFCTFWPDDVAEPAWANAHVNPDEARLIGDVPAPRQPRQFVQPEVVVE